MSLRGKVIAITRPEKQANELTDTISRFGGKPYKVPTIVIKPSLSDNLIKRFTEKIHNEQVDFLIFTSVNGVKILMDYLKPNLEFRKKIEKTTIIAIGPKTKKELEENKIKVNLVPESFSSEGIIKELKNIDVRNKTVVIPRSMEGGEYLVEELKSLGAKVTEIPIYECIVPSDHSKVSVFIKDLIQKRIDVITFTSPSTAQNLFKLSVKFISIGDLRKLLNGIVVVAIGPTTKGALKELGINTDLMPSKYTIEAMLDSIIQHFN
ncbi:MAG: uroporphyrinogen-III synthase [Candidatus Bathyarchaeota archaeon]|nr:uroporphyrinogen-III synthase [Candidatus Bathyarchaeota archaeon]